MSLVPIVIGNKNRPILVVDYNNIIDGVSFFYFFFSIIYVCGALTPALVHRFPTDHQTDGTCRAPNSIEEKKKKNGGPFVGYYISPLADSAHSVYYTCKRQSVAADPWPSIRVSRPSATRVLHVSKRYRLNLPFFFYTYIYKKNRKCCNIISSAAL